MNVTVVERLASYRTLGQESNVTFEAELAGEGFDDIKARAVMSLLQAQMIDEEKIILGGNSSTALGTTPTPSVSIVTTGGALADSTAHRVICVALTYDGYMLNASASSLTQTYSRSNQDGTTETVNGGTAIKSSAGTATTGSSSNASSLVATVTAVQGAYAYAWYVGTSAGTERFAAVTTVNTYTHTTAVPSSTQLATALAATDYSKNTLIHDGLLGFIADSSMSPYFRSLNGSGLTGDGASGIVEWDVALKSFWDNLRLSPDLIIVGSQEATNIRKKILGGGTSATTARFTFMMQQGQMVGGGMAKGYLNPYAMSGGPQEIPIMLHPNMPPGTVLFLTSQLPYQMNNIQNVMQIRARRDYHQIEWPLKTRAYEYGVYSDQVLQHYFIPSMGVITNIGNS
jgi:hypothetical protein